MIYSITAQGVSYGWVANASGEEKMAVTLVRQPAPNCATITAPILPHKEYP